MELVIPSIMYVLKYLGIVLLITVFYPVLLEIVYYLTTGSSFVYNYSNITNILIFAWIFLGLLSPYAILRYGFEIEPPFINKQNMALSSDKTTSRLSNEVSRIHRSLSNIENLTIKEIQQELSKTLQFVTMMKNEAENQEKLIIDLRKKAAMEQKNANEIKSIADNISSLSVEQIDAIKYIVTKDAKDESKKGFWLGVLVSFPIGFFASLLVLNCKNNRYDVSCWARRKKPCPEKPQFRHARRRSESYWKSGPPVE